MNPSTLERDMLTRMLLTDLELAISLIKIGNLDLANSALENAHVKIIQLESLATRKQPPAVIEA